MDRSTLSKRVSRILACVAIVGIAGMVPTYAISVTVGGTGAITFPASTTPPADAPWVVEGHGYPGDTLQLTGSTFELDLTATTPQFVNINDLLWTIDYTYGGTVSDPGAWSDVTITRNILRSISFDGGPSGTLSQTGTILATWDNDFVTLAEGPTASFLVGGYQVDVTALGIGPIGVTNFGGDAPWIQPSNDLYARFDVTAVPEPVSMIMLGCTGVGMLGARVMRRKKS